jgi:hypothetical protein
MRCDQLRGLSSAADMFLDANIIQPRSEPCPHCHHSYSAALKVCGTFYGMFDNEYLLYEHQLKSGQVAKEFVQAAPWSSGPCFFIGLQVYNPDGTCAQEFLWAEEEIDNC